VTVTHNGPLNRYELKTEHGLAIAVYHDQGNRRLFTHTEVPLEDEGKGYASQLVKEALDDTRRAGFKIQPACSFVVDYVRRHPEYRD
jgi:predicted GNAT family acetyltransferase